ncbi:hypothetical protein [Bradyrhizobium sp. SSUT77]|uniref:hypothetical protein n=1 Tax=Bradyrhizobium sp. SSUT77 TaxID=3040603 RepID=UPI002449FEE4|nr:hypothetical protein [Bradyrhizobium sp. SSUT77]MDH2347743.1 hypothetical protein [Bradyrhizobium sp. SSUT77]
MSAVLLAPRQDGVARRNSASFRFLRPNPRRGGGGRRDRYIYADGATTVLALGLVLNILAIGLFCWVIFALAVYALPFFVALSVGMWAFRHGAGVFGALLIGIASGALTLAAGQVAVAFSRSLTLRVAIATAFAVPAAIAGYHVMFALSQIGVPSLAWREAFACVGAVCIGGTAWARLTIFAKTCPSKSVGVVENTPRPVLTAVTHE